LPRSAQDALEWPCAVGDHDDVDLCLDQQPADAALDAIGTDPGRGRPAQETQSSLFGERVGVRNLSRSLTGIQPDRSGKLSSDHSVFPTVTVVVANSGGLLGRGALRGCMDTGVSVMSS